MCIDPATAGFILSVASSAAGVVQQSQQASAEAARARQVEVNATAAFNAKEAATNLRLSQEAAAKSQRVQNVQIDRLKAQSTAEVAAGEAGVGGQGVDAILQDFERSDARFRAAEATNFRFLEQQAQDDLKGFSAEAQGRILDAQPTTSAPSFLGAALRIGGSVASGLSVDKKTGKIIIKR